MKLKPVIINGSRYEKFSQDDSRQKMLLSALKVTRDPKKLKDMIGVKKVADVFRTLDKMSIRKEYHQALIKNGIDFDFILEGIKSECLVAESSTDRLKAYQILLKSMGMDKYEEPAEGGGGWEDALSKVVEADTEDIAIGTDYKVEQPRIPESVKKMRLEESKDMADLYKKNYE